MTVARCIERHGYTGSGPSLYVITYARNGSAPPAPRRPARPRAARGHGPVAARPGRALGRLGPDALPGRARRDQPDAGGGRAHRRGARAAPLPAAAPRRGRRGVGRARRRAPQGGGARATATRSSPRRCPASAPRSRATRSRPGAPTGGPGDPPMHEPGSRETARRRERRACELVCDGERHELAAGDAVTFDADLPHHFENPGPGEATLSGGRLRRAQTELAPPCPRRCSTRSGRRHEVAPGLLYIDLHLVHEVTSAQAFDGLRLEGRTVRRPDRTLATADHNVPTDGTPVAARIRDKLSRVQVETLERNCAEFGIPLYSLGSDRQGIVHVIGPELGRHPAGHDDRLRRLPHRHPRRLRRARLRDRHERGRARPRHPVHEPVQAQVDAHPLRGRARLRRHRQGPDPRHDRPDRRRRRRRPRGRVRRPGRSRRSRWRAA